MNDAILSKLMIRLTRYRKQCLESRTPPQCPLFSLRGRARFECVLFLLDVRGGSDNVDLNRRLIWNRSLWSFSPSFRHDRRLFTKSSRCLPRISFEFCAL